MIDNLIAMQSTDIEFSRLLGAELDWTKYVQDVLRSKGVKSNGADFEDIVTDIVTDLIIALGTKDSLKNAVAQANGDVNKLKPLMMTAIDFRYRDFRTRPAARIGRHEFPEKFEQGKRYPVDAELNATALQEMIEAELELRSRNAPQKRQPFFRLTKNFLADKIAGLGLAEICEKYDIRKGGATTNVMKELTSVVTTVANRLGESWILNLFK